MTTYVHLDVPVPEDEDKVSMGVFLGVSFGGIALVLGLALLVNVVRKATPPHEQSLMPRAALGSMMGAWGLTVAKMARSPVGILLLLLEVGMFAGVAIGGLVNVCVRLPTSPPRCSRFPSPLPTY